MAPKRIQTDNRRGGDRHKKNSALRSSEARQKKSTFVKTLQSQTNKLTEENATLKALQKENQKLKQQLKYRVSMQGSCFLASESVRQLCFKNLASPLEGHHTGVL
jgi:hypothetical protein